MRWDGMVLLLGVVSLVKRKGVDVGRTGSRRKREG